jgi:hypothetical protein
MSNCWRLRALLLALPQKELNRPNKSANWPSGHFDLGPLAGYWGAGVLGAGLARTSEAAELGGWAMGHWLADSVISLVTGAVLLRKCCESALTSQPGGCLGLLGTRAGEQLRDQGGQGAKYWPPSAPRALGLARGGLGGAECGPGGPTWSLGFRWVRWSVTPRPAPGLAPLPLFRAGGWQLAAGGVRPRAFLAHRPGPLAPIACFVSVSPCAASCFVARSSAGQWRRKTASPIPVARNKEVI